MDALPGLTTTCVLVISTSVAPAVIKVILSFPNCKCVFKSVLCLIYAGIIKSALSPRVTSFCRVDVPSTVALPFNCIVASFELLPSAIVSDVLTVKDLPIAIESDCDAVFPRPSVTE